MHLSFGNSLWVMALLAVGAAVLAFWMYRRTTPPLAGALRWILTGLRFLSLFLILLLLADPLLRSVATVSRQPVVAVLIDDSESIAVATGDSLPDAYAEALQRLPVDAMGGDVRAYRFSRLAGRLPERAARWSDSLQLRGTRTNLSGALAQVRRDLQDEPLAAVVLVSDGQYNAGRNPVYAAETYPVPIITAVVGDTTRRTDAAMLDVAANDLAYVRVEQPVRARVRLENAPAGEVAVTLREGNRVLARQAFEAQQGTVEYDVELSFTPEAPGLRQFTVSVSPLGGEKTLQNNTSSFAVRVLDSKREVLVVGGAPGPDLAALERTLGSDADIRLTTAVQKDATSFYDAAPSGDLSRFALIVLVGYPADAGDSALLRRVAAAAADGTPLLVLVNAGTQTDALRASLGDLLPVVPPRGGSGLTEVRPTLTAEGRGHPILDVQNLADMRRLPPLQLPFGPWQVQPDARVLLAMQVNGTALDAPLFVVGSRSGRRSAVLLAGGFWRWTNLPPSAGALSDLWPTVLRNTVSWLTAPEDARPVRIRPVSASFEGGEPVRFSGRVLDERLEAIPNASVTVEVSAPGGAATTASLKPLGGGRYEADLGALPEGTYTYSAKAIGPSGPLGEDQGSFSVGRSNAEFAQLQPNTALMRQIALRSGGTMISAQELGRVPVWLAQGDHLKPLETSVEKTIALRRTVIMLGIILVLLSAEWFLRKRRGLS